MEKSKAGEYSVGQMDPNMKVTLRIIISTAMEHTDGQMAACMLDSGGSI